MKIRTARLETFSDGVIAIIITIMVLELKLPDLNKNSSTEEIILLMKHEFPYFVIYAFSFMMIGIFWTNHHHMFHLLETTDEYLVWLNMVFLFLLSLIPFATAIVGANPFIAISPVTYGIVMLLTTAAFVFMRNYALRKKLVHKDSDRKLNFQIFRVSVKGRAKALAGMFIYMVAIPLAFVNVYIAYFCFILPAVIFFIPDGIDDEKLAEKVAEKNS